ncbi:MAG TPA: DUF2271 domain-containing protein [Negativicutes bacterium]|nr:DUF2271 domain-containing protein [Negativicutes bacterium]
MRKTGKLIVLLLAVLLAVAAAGIAGAESAQSPGTVTISYDLHRIPSIASNQLAVWIETADGAFVKTLYVTRFTGKGGYERRPECLPLWRKAAGVESPPSADVDAVTQATQAPGRQTLTWDCTDAAGNAVAPGKYIYKLEGTLYWTKEVLWTGEITVGGAPASSRADAGYLPPAAQGGEPLVLDVAASFKPR